MYKCPLTGSHSVGIIHFLGEEGASSYSPEYFETESEHITLSTGVAADGVSAEGSYVNHTECFGGTFTGI